jgi:preprotein translocase subunit SecD
VEQSQSFGPILVLLVLIVSFLYMHFTNGSGLTRIYLAGAIVLAAILIMLPSLNVDLPDWFKAGFGATKIQLGLDLQGGTHLLMAVKLDEAVKTQLRRRADDLKKELKDNKIDFRKSQRQAQVERRPHAVPRPGTEIVLGFDRVEQHRFVRRRGVFTRLQAAGVADDSNQRDGPGAGNDSQSNRSARRARDHRRQRGR